MAEPRSLKDGRLFVLEDGSNRPLWNESIGNPQGIAGFVDNSGNYVVLYKDSANDVRRKTGSHFLTLGSVADPGAEVLDQTYGYRTLSVLQIGASTHLWYAYDVAGGTNYSIFYDVSTDGGATWSGSPAEVIALGAGATWNDTIMLTCGAWHDSDNSKVYLLCVGNDGSKYQLGRWEISDAADFAVSGNYTAYASNPVFPPDETFNYGGYVAACHDGSKWHIYYGEDSSPQYLYHNSSSDGITWDFPEGSPDILAIGVSGTNDDTSMFPDGAFFYRGWYYLFYRGNDGATTRPMLAIGQKPDKLYKVGNISNLIAGTYSEVYYSEGLTWKGGQSIAHIPKRAKLGALVGGMEAPVDGSFTFKLQGIGTLGSGASSDDTELWADMLLTSPSVNEGTTWENQVNPCHILYRIDDSEDTAESFYLFLRCIAGPVDVTEAEEGDNVTVNFNSYGATVPVVGEY